jgi:phage tail sheath protein FI
MPELSYPGVYVQEVSSGVRPIEVASTSTPAFVGLAERGPTDRALRVTSWTAFQRYFGSFIDDGYLAQSVFQFFNNGGRQCYVVRIARSDVAVASVSIQNRAPTPTDGLLFSAKNAGAWGNHLYLQIEDGSTDPGNTFKISVREQEEADLVPEDFLDIPPLEIHDDLSMDVNSSRYLVDVLLQSSTLIDATVLAANVALQRGVHFGGFGLALPLDVNRDFQINLDHDGYQLVQLDAAIAAETDLAVVAAEIQTRVRTLTRIRNSTLAVAFSGFTCQVETVDGQDRLVLRSGTNADPTDPTTQSTLSSVQIQNASTNNATGALRLGVANGGRSEDALAVRRPANTPTGEVFQIGDATVAGAVTAITTGSDGEAALNDTSYSAGFQLLNNISDVSLLAVPGVGTTGIFDEGVAYCAGRSLQDMFYVGETDLDTDTPAEAETFRGALTTPNSYGALYFPWIQAPDPTGRSAEPVLLPPSGFITGLYARIDANRGVWKSPAGTEASLNGTRGLAVVLTDIENGNLNKLNINCIRQFPTAGIVSWGARTITSDPEWKYLSPRRMAILLRVSIYNGIQWAVFEPNDEPLWAALRLNITSFMTVLFRQGAFQGSSPSQAFFVKVDSETTTQDDINLGIVNVLVGFAPLKPAEFVVVKISQKAGQSS